MIDVEELELEHGANLRWDGAIEGVVGECEGFEGDKISELSGNSAGEAHTGDVEGLEGLNVTEFGWDGALVGVASRLPDFEFWHGADLGGDTAS